MQIREATAADLPAVAGIYGREALEGHATFDLEPRPMDLWEDKLGSTGRGDHFLVAEHEGTVAGYATSSPFRPKPAYLHTRETTVYVAPGHQGVGVGRRLSDALLALLADDPAVDGPPVVAELSAVLGVHVGPGTLGVVVAPAG